MNDGNCTATEYIVSNSIIQNASLMNNFNRKQTNVKGIRMTINVLPRTQRLLAILSIIDAVICIDIAHAYADNNVNNEMISEHLRLLFKHYLAHLMAMENCLK